MDFESYGSPQRTMDIGPGLGLESFGFAVLPANPKGASAPRMHHAASLLVPARANGRRVIRAIP